jgi:hypothetical protein
MHQRCLGIARNHKHVRITIADVSEVLQITTFSNTKSLTVSLSHGDTNYQLCRGEWCINAGCGSA